MDQLERMFEHLFTFFAPRKDNVLIEKNKTNMKASFPQGKAYKKF